MSAEDGNQNPAAALLRLQRCRVLEEVPALAQTLFRQLRGRGWHELATRLAEALMRQLQARIAGAPTAADAELMQQALRYMENPLMIAESAARWRREAIAEGLAAGRAAGQRQLLARIAGRRFGPAAGTRLAALLAAEDDEDALAQVGELIPACEDAERLLAGSQAALRNGRAGGPAT